MSYLAAGFFGLGWPELLVILFVILLILGPKQLPKLGRMLGKGVRDFRDSANKLSGEEEDDEQSADQRRERLAKESQPVNTPAPRPQ